MPTLAKLYDIDCCVSFDGNGGVLWELPVNVRQFRATTLINVRKVRGSMPAPEAMLEEEWVNTFLSPAPHGLEP